MLKFIYSEKATKFCEIFTLLLSYNVVPVKSKVKILQNFVAFSEYMNFNIEYWWCCIIKVETLNSPVFFLKGIFLTFPADFWIPIILSNMNWSNVLDLSNLMEQVKKHSVSKIELTFHCFNKLFHWYQKTLQILSIQPWLSIVVLAQ